MIVCVCVCGMEKRALGNNDPREKARRGGQRKKKESVGVLDYVCVDCYLLVLFLLTVLLVHDNTQSVFKTLRSHHLSVHRSTSLALLIHPPPIFSFPSTIHQSISTSSLTQRLDISPLYLLYENICLAYWLNPWP